MASPQPDKFTSFSNELLEAFIQAARFLSPYESAVWLCILRKTYGFRKKEDWIALSQIEKMTKITSQNVARTISKLKEKNMITRCGEQGKVSKTSIQKDYSLWNLPELVSIQILSKQIATTIQTDSSATQRTTIQTDRHKRNKRNYTKERRRDSFSLDDLKTNPAYSHIDIPRELHKMDAWISANPGRKKTERFIINWLNRIEPGANGAHKERPKV